MGVDRRRIDRHIGMVRIDHLQALRRRQEADIADGGRPCPLDPVDRGDGGMARGQHRIEDKDFALGDIDGQLAVILDRRQRLRVAIDPDMPHARVRHDLQHPVEESVAGAQDRDEAHILGGKNRRFHRRDRRRDGHRLQALVAHHLVGEQHGDLAQQTAELCRSRLLLAHMGELVLDQRVLDDSRLCVHAISVAGARLAGALYLRRRQLRLGRQQPRLGRPTP